MYLSIEFIRIIKYISSWRSMPQRRAEGIPWIIQVIPNKIPTCQFQLFSNKSLGGFWLLPGEMNEREPFGKSLCYYVVWLRVTALWKQLTRTAITTTTKTNEQLWAVSDYGATITGHYLQACIYLYIYVHTLLYVLVICELLWQTFGD